MWIEETKTGYRAVERYKDAFGKTKRVSVVMKKNTPQERNKAMAKLNNKIVSLQEKKTESATLGELFDEFKQLHIDKLKPNTQVSYKNVFRLFFEQFDKITDVKTVTTRQLNLYFLELGKKHTIATLKTHRAKIAKFFDYALDNELIDKNPARKIVLNSKVKRSKKTKFLDHDQIKELLELIDKETNDTYKDLTLLLLFTGLRIGEALALQWSDIDFKNKELSVTKSMDADGTILTPKTQNSVRRVSLTDNVIDMLKFRNQAACHDLVFTSAYGVFLKRASYSYWLKHLDFDVELNAHMFRHTHVSMLAELGVPMKTIMDRVGHTDSKTTLEIYTHVTKRSKDVAVERLNNYL